MNSKRNAGLDVCHRPDGLEVGHKKEPHLRLVCHRPDGLEVIHSLPVSPQIVCHRPDGLEDPTKIELFHY